MKTAYIIKKIAGLAAVTAGAVALARSGPTTAPVLPGSPPRTPGMGDLMLYAGDPHDGDTTVDAAGVVHHHRTPAGPRVVRLHLPAAYYDTNHADRCAWSRYAAGLFRRVGVDPPQAVFLAALAARETGFGRYAWNYAIGNVKQYTATGFWHRLSDGEPYEAYPSAEAGARRLLQILQSPRYATAWAKLQDVDVSWYGDLGRAGYYESSPEHGQAEYSGTFLPAVEACLAADTSAAYLAAASAAVVRRFIVP